MITSFLFSSRWKLREHVDSGALATFFVRWAGEATAQPSNEEAQPDIGRYTSREFFDCMNGSETVRVVVEIDELVDVIFDEESSVRGITKALSHAVIARKKYKNIPALAKEFRLTQRAVKEIIASEARAAQYQLSFD